MVRADKLQSALYALNAVLVVAREMAYEAKPTGDIARVLDIAEYLPALLARPDDRTDEYLAHLVDLANQNDAFRLAVKRFEQAAPSTW